MKKVLVVIVVSVVSFLCGLVVQDRTPLAKAQDGRCATQSGDTDGELGLTLNDAIRTLNFLFLGGPPPVPLCQPIPCPLPATGVTECADVDGQLQDPCPESEARRYPGQDGFYQAGCPREGRFIVNDSSTREDTSDDTVTDTCTGLMWQSKRAQASATYDPEMDGYLTWEQALAYCAALGDDPTADVMFSTSFNDWRLPNVRELQSIINYGQRTPALPSAFDIQTSTDYTVEWYASSSSFPGIPNGQGDRAYNFAVNLEYGAIEPFLKTSVYYALAVRNVTSQ